MNKIQNDEHTMSPELFAFFRVARLRFRAEECRVIGEDMTTHDNRALMQRLAADYDQLADSLENKHVVH